MGIGTDDARAGLRPGVRLGVRVGPFAGSLDPDLVRQFAAATRDPSEPARAGTAVTPTAIVTQIWTAQEEARSQLVDAEVAAAARGGVHGSHDIVLHRPIVPGERLRTWVDGHGARPAGANAVITLRYETIDDAGAVVAEQWWSTVYLGTRCAETGSPAPAHGFPETARQSPLGALAIEIDLEMARRYAGVSGDWSPHHFDVEAAKRSGSDRPFLHGLCTMALCGQAVARLAGQDDPQRVRRLAVRFVRPTPLGSELRVSAFDLGGGRLAFEAHCDETLVIGQGRMELRSS